MITPENKIAIKIIDNTGVPWISLKYLSSSKKENNTLDPSNGGMGMQLKIPKPMDK